MCTGESESSAENSLMNEGLITAYENSRETYLQSYNQADDRVSFYQEKLDNVNERIDELQIDEDFYQQQKEAGRTTSRDELEAYSRENQMESAINDKSEFERQLSSWTDAMNEAEKNYNEYNDKIIQLKR